MAGSMADYVENLPQKSNGAKPGTKLFCPFVVGDKIVFSGDSWRARRNKTTTVLLS